jgi:alkylhydroperoxidase family enzyme
MPWIKIIPPAEAEGELEELYQQVRDPSTEVVDNILGVHSLHPAGLASHYELYRAVMSPTRGLRRAEREMIALVVSQINECHY